MRRDAGKRDRTLFQILMARVLNGQLPPSAHPLAIHFKSVDTKGNRVNPKYRCMRGCMIELA